MHRVIIGEDGKSYALFDPITRLKLSHAKKVHDLEEKLQNSAWTIHDLIEALEYTLTELNEYAIHFQGANFKSPRINKVIARAKGQEE